MNTLGYFGGLIDLVSASLNLGLGAFIFAKNRKSEVNQSLAFFLFFVAFWIFSSVFVSYTGNPAFFLLARRFSSFSSSLIVTFFLYFSFVFPERDKYLSWPIKLLILLPGFIFAFLSLTTSSMIKELLIDMEVGSRVIYGDLYRYATIFYITYLSLSFANLIIKYLKAKGEQRLQISYVLFGIGIAGLTAILTSLVLPLIGFSQFVMVGPPTTLIMAAFLTYAIVTHQLLKIEDFLSRGVLHLSLAAGVVGTLAMVQFGRLSFLPSFYLSLFNFGLAVFVFFQNKKSPVNLSFSLAIFIAAAWTFSIGLFLESDNLSQLVFWSKVFYVEGALIPGILLYFSTVFPTPGPILAKWQKVLIFIPSIIVSFIAMFTNYIIESFSLSSTGITAVIGPFYPYFVGFNSIFMGLAFLNLFAKYFYVSAIDKARVRYVLLGLSIVGFFALVFNLILPWLGNYNLIWVGTYSSIFLAGSTAYAIVRYRLMDMSLIISRALAELLANSFVVIVYVILVWIYQTYVSSQIDLPFILLSILFCLILVYLHKNIRLFFQTTSDRFFLHGKYDYYQTLAETSRRVGAKLTLPAILQIMYEIFSEVVQIDNPRIFLPDRFAEVERTSKCYVVYDRDNFQPRLTGDNIDFDNPMVKQMLTERGPIFNPHDTESHLIVPCLLEGRLVAFFVLGQKLSEDPYTDEDVRLLQSLGDQAALALDHARSYEKIKGDLELAETQVSRSERLASLGTLIAGVTHEIRNPLTVLKYEAEELADEQRSLEYLKEKRSLLLKHINRISSIVSEMLSFSKTKKEKAVEIDLNELMNSTLELLPLKKVVLKKDFGQIAKILGKPEQLCQVFINIFQNALQFMPENGLLTVRTFMSGGRVIVEISDTGEGIPEEIREKIFDPFFSTRHEGTGLGLSIVYKIVREHGGDIVVRSSLGQGTTFILTF
ncbi:MAG: ATP-binding protein [bacterium]